MNYPNGLTARDYAHIEGHDLTDADRDELRGQDWMRSLPVAEHAAIAMAVTEGGRVFRASCRCGWKGPYQYVRRGRSRWATVEEAKTGAQADANEHNKSGRAE